MRQLAWSLGGENSWGSLCLYHHQSANKLLPTSETRARCGKEIHLLTRRAVCLLGSALRRPACLSPGLQAPPVDLGSVGRSRNSHLFRAREWGEISMTLATQCPFCFFLSVLVRPCQSHKLRMYGQHLLSIRSETALTTRGARQFQERHGRSRFLRFLNVSQDTHTASCVLFSVGACTSRIGGALVGNHSDLLPNLRLPMIIPRWDPPTSLKLMEVRAVWPSLSKLAPRLEQSTH